MAQTRLVLASSSPRRHELLRRLIPGFEVATSSVEEEGSSLIPAWTISPLDVPQDYAVPVESHPTLWAWRKAVDVCRQLGNPSDAYILAADTIVIGKGKIMGKPGINEVAARMLAELRGKKHFVATGGVLLRASEAESTIAPHQFLVVSTVWMRDYSDREMVEYVATGEPLDKAGAYAVQELGGKLVERVEGCYYTVVGLPLCEARNALVEASIPVEPYPPAGYCDFCPLRANR
jgi:septum formation protein